MALNSGKILMRRGQEVNFDPNKMTPGEWAVSLDSKYVRMCFSPGACVRIATYDAFEADMEQIRQILSQCQTIEEAVTRINNEISVKEEAVAEYTEQAKQYRDEAEQFKNQAFSSTPEGYLQLVEQVEENTRRIEEGGGDETSGTLDYEELENKPSINNIELSGNKTLQELGIQPQGDYPTRDSLKPYVFSNPTNNLLATEAGTPLDAVQGKVLGDKLGSYSFDTSVIDSNTIFGNRIMFGILAKSSEVESISDCFKKLGISTNSTILEVMEKICQTEVRLEFIKINFNWNSSTFNQSLPLPNPGVLEIYRDEATRAILKLNYIDGDEYINTYANGALGTWKKLVTETVLNNSLKTRSNIVYRNQISAGSSATIRMEQNHSYQITFSHPSTSPGYENSRGFYICSAYNFNNNYNYIAITPVKEATNITFTQSSMDLTISVANSAAWCTIVDLGSRADIIP